MVEESGDPFTVCSVFSCALIQADEDIDIDGQGTVWAMTISF